MALNSTAMVALANKLRTEMLLYGQLHNGPAGGSYTSNVIAITRVAPVWDTATGLGDFHLASACVFNGGTPGANIYSLTLWTAVTNGTCYGEFVFGSGSDSAFNPVGSFSVTVIDFAGGVAEGS